MSLPSCERTMETKLGFTDRKSTRLNSSHLVISYAVFCLKKKKSIGLRPPETVFLKHFNFHLFWAIRSPAGLSASPSPSAQTSPAEVGELSPFFFLNDAGPPGLLPFPPHAPLQI